MSDISITLKHFNNHCSKALMLASLKKNLFTIVLLILKILILRKTVVMLIFGNIDVTVATYRLKEKDILM